MLPIICVALVLRLERVRRSACIDMDMFGGLLQRLLVVLAEFQHSVVNCATDHCQKRLKTCMNAEGGHSEHLL